MISLFEPVSEGAEHSPVNAALVEIVGLAFPDAPLTFYGSAQHIADVKAALNSRSVDRTVWVALPIAPRRGGLSQRARTDGRLLFRVASENRRAGGGHVLALNAVPTILLAAAIGRRLGIIRSPVQAVVHGYLNEAVGWRSRNPFLRAIDMRSALSAATGSVTLVALETGIAAAMRAAMPKVGSRMVTLRHPLPVLRRPSPRSSYEPGQPLRIGFLGLATREKGFETFVAAARRLKAVHGPAIEFHVIGRMPPRSNVDLGSLAGALSTLPVTDPMPRDEYDARVGTLHYACLPFQADHYTLSPSGVLLDALAHAKPVFAAATPATREVFAEGRPGALLERPEDLADAIETVLRELTPSTYDRQVDEMSRARALRDPEHLAKDYRAFTKMLGG